MKQKLQNILFLFILGTIGAKAQVPVITAAGVNPRIGESYKITYLISKSITPPNSGGISKIWDYSSLIDSIDVTINILSPKGLSGSDSFPDANIAFQIASGGINISYEFDKVDTSGWKEVGYYNSSKPTPLYEKFNPNVPLIYYPISYNKTYTDIDGQYINGHNPTTIYDTISSDAYGTLKLPNGVVYTNVLRLKEAQTYVSSADGKVEASDIIYLFFVNGTHWPIMELVNPNGNAWQGFYYSGIPLPLQISSFTVSWQNKMAYLKWNAANTANTKQFNIQRSLDGYNFETVGQVGIIAGSSYHFEDNYKPSGIIYYRLEQLDINGQAFYSNITRLAVNSNQISAYPNPAKDKLTVTGNHIASIQVINDIGKVIKTVYLKDATNPSLFVNGLLAGTYHLQVQTTDGMVSGVALVVSY